MSYNSKRSGQEVENLLDQVGNKVDKINGKGLSTEDFTTALKDKLSGLNNYDDAELRNAISSLQNQLNTLVSGNPSDAINSFNEIIAFLDGIKDSQDLSSIIASIEQQIADKMDKVTLSNVATSGSYNDLKDKPTIPINLSDLGEDSTHRVVTDTEKSTWNAKSNFSGSYNDLTNKPSIPTQVTESTVSGWGFTKNTGTYSKPSGGIPKTDLASTVQSSLDKADTALQTEQYKGTVTGVKINGTTKNPSSGVVDLGTVLTTEKGTTIYYGECDTESTNNTKIVTIQDFELKVGVLVVIKFHNGTGTDPSGNTLTLNISNTGEYPLMRYGTTAMSGGTTTSGLSAGAVQMFAFDGSRWIRDFWYNTTYTNLSLGQGYATCSTAETTLAKTAALSSYSTSTPYGIVVIKFTNNVPANSTLNINSRGEKAIYYKDAPIVNGIIKAGDTATFMYNTNYYLISIDRFESGGVSEDYVNTAISNAITNTLNKEV